MRFAAATVMLLSQPQAQPKLAVVCPACLVLCAELPQATAELLTNLRSPEQTDALLLGSLPAQVVQAFDTRGASGIQSCSMSTDWLGCLWSSCAQPVQHHRQAGLFCVAAAQRDEPDPLGRHVNRTIACTVHDSKRSGRERLPVKCRQGRPCTLGPW